MLVENQQISVKWTRRNRRQYESKGYIYTNIDEEFLVSHFDLSSGSHAKVKFVCDYCLGENQKEEKNKWKVYKQLLIQRQSTNKDCCSDSTCKNKKTHEVFINNLIKNKDTLGDKYQNLILEWSPKNEKDAFQYSYGSECEVWWRCKHGHEWETKILNRTRKENPTFCPYCSGRKVCIDNCLSTIRPDLALEWDYIKNKGLTPHDVTKGYGRVWWICKKCNHSWNIQVSKRYHGNGCPQCKESKGEKRIREYLLLHGISYKPQYEFKGLLGLGGNRLKFDFVIFDKQCDIQLLVEYDGEYHYKKFYKDDGHERTVEHDKRKNDYCKKNNIPLLRIPYWEFDNIEEILTNEITKYNLLG